MTDGSRLNNTGTSMNCLVGYHPPKGTALWTMELNAYPAPWFWVESTNA